MKPSKPEDVAAAIVSIPRALSSGNVSLYELAHQYGYFEQASNVGEDVIRACLAAQPVLVDDWLVYSEDKRTSSGWYIRSVAHGYEVGCVGDPAGRNYVFRDSEKLDACAKFIKNELEAMRVAS